MRYLGKIAGNGLLKRENAVDVPVGYNLDIFSRPGTGRTVSGELSASAETLRHAFGRKNVRVQIEDGSHIDLFFDESKLENGSVVAHVASRAIAGAVQRPAAASTR